MRVRTAVFAAVLASAPLAGCNSEHWFDGMFALNPLPGPMHQGRCGLDSHTESYPHARDEAHAYGCKSNDAGYLEGAGQGDKRGN